MFTADYPKHTLKADEYLLVGDNRVNSLDSRSESVGPFLAKSNTCERHVCLLSF